ncbi:MAG: radical SAM protein [Candidatus Omnitrophota bacterium]|nr:MAG: radical SAM protein [Candidatus Omnitrophota bacterium]
MDCPHIPRTSYSEFSEKIHTKIRQNRTPLNGSIELTFRCNLNCAHCYCTHQPLKKELSFKEVCRIFDEASEAGCLWLLITGGEPLLRDDFLDIYTYAKKKGMITTLFTNGTLITPYIADYLKDYPPFVTEISVYGITPQVYENVTGVSDSFYRCMRGIDLLLGRNLPLRIKTVAMSINKNEMLAMERFAKQLGLEFRYDPVINPKLDGSKEPCQVRITPQKAVELDLASQKRIKEWKDFCQEFSDYPPSEKLYVCAAGLDAFHIDPYGALSVCVMSRQPSYDILSGSFQEGWYEFIPRAVLSQRFMTDFRCAQCAVRSLCDTCPGWAQLEKGNPEAPVEYLCQIAHLRAAHFSPRKEVAGTR